MKLQRTFTLLLIVLFSLGLAACGGDEDPTATPEPAVVAATDTPAPPTNTPLPPTNTPAPAAAQPTDTPVATPASASSNFQAPSTALKSYRTQGQFLITTTFSDGTSKVQDMVLEGAYTSADNAYGSDESFLMTIKEDGSEESVAIYKIGDWVSAKSEGEWITVGRDNAGLFTAMSDLFTGFVDQFVLEQEGAVNLGDETVGGQAATHYRIDDINIFQRMAQMAPDSTEVIEEVGMEIWVAKEGNYILQYSIQAKVSNVKETDANGAETTATQTVNWTYTISDANSDFTISLPADAPEPGVVSIPGFAEGEFPLPEGGKIAANMIGMPEISSDLSQEELVAFYTEAFAGLGWEFTGDFGFYEVKKGEISFSMFIDAADNGTGRAQIFVGQ